jgi:monofunctional biosynthetic peptidoglycan transglycosylase
MVGAARQSKMSRFLRWLALVVAAALSLQIFFIGRIAMMAVVDPQSTTFERSEAWRIVTEKGALRWRQNWVPYAQLSDSLKRAVIASEDGDFVNHDGVEWEAVQKAWDKNARAEELAAKRTPPARPGKPTLPAKTPKVIGGSTITQQLAKNLLLSGERTFLRKGQEFLLTVTLELLLSKQRILEIYLNNVEWGEGVFGAEAAAQHYYRKPAARLSAYEAARLAVMLPRPKYFEKVPNSPYLSQRASIIVARMGDAELP